MFDLLTIKRMNAKASRKATATTSKSGYTFYRGMENAAELRVYLSKHGDLPTCESFKRLKPGDEKLINGLGFIAEESFDPDLWRTLPATLKECLPA